jgi:cytochrome c
MPTFDRRLRMSTTLGLGLVVVLWTALTAQTPGPALRSTKPDDTRFTPTVLVPHGELDEPMMVAVLPDERALIIERKGGFKVYDPSTNTTSLIATIPVNTKYYSASGRVTEAEEGLIGLTIDPSFSKNRWVYLKYADPQVAKWVLARWELQDQKTA